VEDAEQAGTSIARLRINAAEAETDAQGGFMRKTCMTAAALLAACALGAGMPAFAQNSSGDQGRSESTFKRGTDGEPVSGQSDTQSGPQQSSQPNTGSSTRSQDDSAAQPGQSGQDAVKFKRGADGEPVTGPSSASESDRSSASQQGSSQSPR
jgi:hypothetical protein